MFYIEEENDELIKYEIIFDKEKLRDLKFEILKNCGKIIHRSFNSDYGPGVNLSHTKNYSCKEIGKKEYFEETRELYHYEFDKYIDTKLITLIDRLLEGDVSAITEIKKPEKQEIEKDEKAELRKKIEEILTHDISEIDTWKLEKLKEQIKEYQLNEKLNKNQKSDLEYYPKVLDCIEFREISRCKTEQIAKIDGLVKQMEQFFEGTAKNSSCNTQYQKIISKLYQQN